jgi:ABC-type branched-subunit amino acid transport system substrate-binding protein
LNRAIVAALLLVFIAALPAHRTFAADSATPLRQGLELYRSGTLEQAVPLLKTAIAQNPDASEVWQAHLVLARIYYQQGKLAEALAELGAIPPEHRNPETRLLEGLALIKTGQPAPGVDLLLGLQESDLNGIQQQKRLDALTRGHLRLERYPEALFFIHQSLRSSRDPSRISNLLQQAHTVFKDRASDAELAEAAFLYQGTPLGQDALLQQAWRQKQAGDPDQALLLVNYVLNSPVDFPFRNDAELLSQQLSDGGASRALGVLLPLSGRFSNFGRMVLKGMKLALEMHNRQSSPVVFLVRDSAGDPNLSAQHVADLAALPQVFGIVGPLTGNASESAAHKAQQKQIPLLTLSQRAGLPGVGSWIFRNSLTSEMQARRLVDYALNQRQLQSFGILAPDTRLGREISQAFADEVHARGGRIVAMQNYDPQTTDFRRQIKLLQGKNPDRPEPEKDDTAKGEAEPPPFDALFIPDTPDRLALIAPQLPFYGLSNITLLGSASWDTPDLLPKAGQYLQKAVFVSGFFRYSPYPFVQDFVDRFFERYGTEPSLLEAQGYDVAGIMLSLLEQQVPANRENIGRGLMRMRNYPGVTGATGFTPAGDADKLLYLLGIQDGTLVQLN